MAQSYGRSAYRYMEMLITAAIIYWLLSFLLELVPTRIWKSLPGGKARCYHDAKLEVRLTVPQSQARLQSPPSASLAGIGGTILRAAAIDCQLTAQPLQMQAAIISCLTVSRC